MAVIAGIFAAVYQRVNVPLTLGTAVLGVAAVMIVRFTASFLVAWFRETLRMSYIRDLQTEAFGNAFDADIAYLDETGSDDVLNAIITQTFYAGQVIERLVLFVEQSFLGIVYGLIAFAVSPVLTILTVIVLGGVTVLLRVVVEPGYDIGNRVADANERRQKAAQAGTQGMRESRIFGLVDELYGDFVEAVDKYTRARVKLRRNEAAIDNAYQLTVAVSVFALIYVSLTYVELTLSSLGLFLFAMFRLGPKASRANELFYRIEQDLPHLVRTRQFTRDLARNAEPDTACCEVPGTIESVAFDDVSFAYDEDTEVLRAVDFSVDRGEFVAFVGQSGRGSRPSSRCSHGCTNRPTARSGRTAFRLARWISTSGATTSPSWSKTLHLRRHARVQPDDRRQRRLLGGGRAGLRDRPGRRVPRRPSGRLRDAGRRRRRAARADRNSASPSPGTARRRGRVVAGRGDERSGLEPGARRSSRDRDDGPGVSRRHRRPSVDHGPER